MTEQAYIESHSSCPTEVLEWVKVQTHLRTNHARMLSGEPQGQLLKMLVTLTGARSVLELGAFTGYSTLCLAEGMKPLSDDAQYADLCLDTLELNDEMEDFLHEVFSRAHSERFIHLHIGDAKESLQKFAQEKRQYDLIFIDANKREYPLYYEACLPLLRVGGLMVADNVLWDGKAYNEPLSQDKQSVGIRTFNECVIADPRVENVILPLRDGLNLIRKKY